MSNFFFGKKSLIKKTFLLWYDKGGMNLKEKIELSQCLCTKTEVEDKKVKIYFTLQQEQRFILTMNAIVAKEGEYKIWMSVVHDFEGKCPYCEKKGYYWDDIDIKSNYLIDCQAFGFDVMKNLYHFFTPKFRLQVLFKKDLVGLLDEKNLFF